MNSQDYFANLQNNCILQICKIKGAKKSEKMDNASEGIFRNFSSPMGFSDICSSARGKIPNEIKCYFCMNFELL